MKTFKTLLIPLLVFVLPLHTNAKNMETHFYHQTTKDAVVLDHIVDNYQSMINDSNLCWAACMESLIKGYKINSEVGYQQLEIAHYYNNRVLHGSVKSQYVEKIAMCDKDHITMYERAGFNIESIEIETLENLSETQTLLKNNNTLLIRRLENERSHILMIVGSMHGRYMILDPDANSKGIYYWSPNKITEKYGIEKLWAVSVHTPES